MSLRSVKRFVDDSPTVTALIIAGLIGVLILLPCTVGAIWIFDQFVLPFPVWVLSFLID